MTKRLYKCSQGQKAGYYEKYDRFGCSICDVWIESCDCLEKNCRFVPCPDKPSLTNQEPEYF